MSDKKVRILLVDDFEVVRIMIREALTAIGYDQIDDAKDGAEAYALMEKSVTEQNPYAVVFCDWNMPNMSGLEVIKKCRANDSLKNLPIVMVTAESDREAVVAALSAGATDYVIKPVGTDMLERKLRRILAREGY